MQSIFKKLLNGIYKIVMILPGRMDSVYLHDDVQSPHEVGHETYINKLLAIANHEGMRVLEIGSREVTGASPMRNLFDCATYVGFDYYPGNNVDVVGDAHQLSNYFAAESFDLIFSSAVFEHLAMPWVVTEEIAKLVKPNGYVFVETHFSFSSHERPWHFFQFSDKGLEVLFSHHLGFKCLDKGMSNPIVARFSSFAAKYLRYKPISGLYCHSEYLGQKIAVPSRKKWSDLKLSEVTGSEKYPEPKDIAE